MANKRHDGIVVAARELIDLIEIRFGAWAHAVWSNRHDEIEDERKRYRSARDELDKYVSKLGADLDTMEDTCQSLEAEVAVLREQRDNAEAEVRELEERIATLEADRNIWRAQAQGVEAHCMKLEKKIPPEGYRVVRPDVTQEMKSAWQKQLPWDVSWDAICKAAAPEAPDV